MIYSRNRINVVMIIVGWLSSILSCLMGWWSCVSFSLVCLCSRWLILVFLCSSFLSWVGLVDSLLLGGEEGWVMSEVDFSWFVGLSVGEFYIVFVVFFDFLVGSEYSGVYDVVYGCFFCCGCYVFFFLVGVVMFFDRCWIGWFFVGWKWLICVLCWGVCVLGW